MIEMYPRLNPAEEQTPIAIEYAYFLEDGEQDPSKPNRYYFNFPQEWCTSNRGESIVGVRSVWMIAKRRKLEFDFSIRKYLRKDFDELKAKAENKDLSNDQIYDKLPEKSKIELTIHVISWLSTENDFRKLFDDINKQLNKKFEEFNGAFLNKYKITTEDIKEITKAYADIMKAYINPYMGRFYFVKDVIAFLFNAPEKYKEYKGKINDWIKQHKEKIVPLFHQDDVNRSLNDFQMDGYYDYDKKAFIETIFSPQNLEKNTISKPSFIYMAPEITDYEPTPTPTPTPKPIPGENDFVELGLYYVDFKINFRESDRTDSNYKNTDFADLFNIGDKPYQNNPYDFNNKWCRRLDFKNIWDRHSCKVYSSIAEQSNKYYLGNSQIYFSPIKYFKLNSTDQRFWIELYSGRHNNIPVLVPNNESFVIEMQFLPFKKMLYI